MDAGTRLAQSQVGYFPIGSHYLVTKGGAGWLAPWIILRVLVSALGTYDIIVCLTRELWK